MQARWALGSAVALTLGALLMIWPPQAKAQAADADLQAINALTHLPETLDLIRQEGIQQGKDLGSDLFGDSEDPNWLSALDRVYDTGQMTGLYNAALRQVLAQDPSLSNNIRPFLDSDLGQRVITLELEARRTTMDKVAMQAAREVFVELEKTDKFRRAQIERLVVAGDLIEANVMAGLNGNLTFYKAMAAVGTPGTPNDEAELLAQVWSQEADIRASVEEFLYPIMALAYAPLNEDELQSYVDFSESPAGTRFNDALSKAFDPLMIELSRKLGTEAGKLLSGQML